MKYQINVFAITIVMIVSACHLSFAQVAINTDGSSSDSSAILDVKSNIAGILIPRMTLAQRTLINDPAQGLMVYQTDGTSGFYYFDGGDWKLVGAGALCINDLTDGKTCSSSVFLGSGAGSQDDGTNNCNVAVGMNALKSDTTGVYNTAIGYNALFDNSSGRHNTALGTLSLESNTSGEGNTGIGTLALWQNTTGVYNTAVGSSSLNSNTYGRFNTGIGNQSLQHNTLGYFNSALGYLALHHNTTGNKNIGIGAYANFNNQEGSNNTIIGYEAGKGTATHDKSGNIFIGYRAGYNDTTDNKLYIENSDSSTPLIFGDFSLDSIGINGAFTVTKDAYFSTSSGRVGIGITNPSEKLEVNGNVIADTAYADAFSSNSPLKLQTGGTTRMYIDDITGNIGINTNAPDNAALVELNSNNKGFLPPRMTEVQRNFFAPVTGLMIYNTTTDRPNYYNGTEWMNFDNTSAATTILAVGDSLQGGIIAYILQTGDPGYDPDQVHGLIAAIGDQSNATEWGCMGTHISTGTAIGTGNQNTINIEAGCTTPGTAADICANLSMNGYTDWYLPSKDELNKLYINKNAIGDLTNHYYWCSSEVSSNYAWGQFLFNGSWQDFAKCSGTIRVRAIRDF